ncbi:MAG: AraC family transcriptional regulator [Planctomycetota bacterium]
MRNKLSNPRVFHKLVRSEETLPDCVQASKTWDGISMSRFVADGADAVELKQGTCDHLLVCNPQGSVYSDQRRDGRRIECPYNAHRINLVPAHEPFIWAWDHGKPGEHGSMVSYHINLRPDRLARLAEESGEIDPDRLQLRHAFHQGDPILTHCFGLLQAELENRGFGSALYVDAVSQALGLHLLRHYATHTPRPTNLPGRLSRKQFNDVRDYIDAHLEDDLRLDDLAEAAYLSKFYFSRLFKRTTGVTPHHYVVERRVERAKAMLKDKRFAHQGIAPIALACGFIDQSHLSRHFKKIVGVTPAAYRREMY